MLLPGFCRCRPDEAPYSWSVNTPSHPTPASDANSHAGLLPRMLSNVAFWQGLGFVMLISLIWVFEVLDLPHAVYGVEATPVDWIGASLLTAGVILVAFIITAHTYLQQKMMLKGFIIVCSYCRKVHVRESRWEQMESYISNRTLADFSHGVCPTCMEEVTKELRKSRPSAPGD